MNGKNRQRLSIFTQKVEAMSPHARADDRPGHNERLDNLYRSESFCCACCDGAFRAINRCCCTSIERRHKPASQGDRILREAVISFCRSTLSTLPVRVPESPQRAASADHFELPLISTRTQPTLSLRVVQLNVYNTEASDIDLQSLRIACTNPGRQISLALEVGGPRRDHPAGAVSARM